MDAGLRSEPLAVAASVVGTALVFGAMHLTFPTAYRPQNKGSADAALVLGLQVFAGLWFGALAAWPGAGLGLAIVTHALYDAATLYSEHFSATSQIAYANSQANWDETHKRSPTAAKWASARGRRWTRDVEFLFHFLDKDRSQTIHAHEMRAGLVAYGIELPPGGLEQIWDRVGAPGPPNTCDLDLDHFMEFVGMLSEGGRGRETHALTDQTRSGIEAKGVLGLGLRQ